VRRTSIVALVLVAVLTACGSPSGSRASGRSRVVTAALVTAAADTAASARSAKISGELSISMGSKDVTVPIDGAIDFVHDAAELRVDMSGADGLTGGARVSGAMDIRMVDGAMYMNVGSMLGSRAGAMLHGKDWVSVDISQAAAQGGTENPADMLQSLRGAGDVRAVGEADVDGTPTTRYHAEIDLQRAVAKVPARYRDLAAKGMRMFGASFPIDVWIDAHGLPRRIAIDIDLSFLGGRVSERIDFRDYGSDVTIEAPPADRVQSMADFQRGANGVSIGTGL
jgi:hypothetical protein